MARAHFVKKARKANKEYGIKKGDSYYWWKFRRGGKRVSKTPPKPSQLTMSDFWSAFYQIGEGATETPAFCDLASSRDDIVSELQNIEDDTQGKFDNMPDGLQQGDTGQLLEERVSAMQEIISEVEGVDCEPEWDESEDKPEGEETDDEKAARKEKWEEEQAEEIWQEVIGALDNISCS